MARSTPNLDLNVWDNPNDQFSRSELAANWDAIDADYTRGRPANSAEIRSTVPSSGNFDGRLIYLTAADSGFPTKSLVRYNGSSWAVVGYEVLSAVPSSSNFAGRLVLLSAANSGFAAWSLIRYDGSAWATAVKGVDVAATVPGTSNYAGRIVCLSGADSGFNAWDVIRFDGSAWAKIGPQGIPPGTELVYSKIASDTTTTSTSLTSLLTFSTEAFENVKYYFDISIPRITASSIADIQVALQESTTPVGNPAEISFNTPSNYKNLSVKIPFTPSAASHTYNVKWSTSAGTATINSTGLAPAIFRIIKA